MTRRPLGIALLVAGVVVGPTTLRLLQTATNEIDRPLAAEQPAAAAAPIFELDLPNDTTDSRTLPIWISSPATFDEARIITVFASAAGTTPTLNFANLRIGTCDFRLTAPLPVRENTPVTLARQKACKAGRAGSAQLRLQATGPGRVALLTWQMPADDAPEHAGLSLTDPAQHLATRSVLRGHVSVTQGPGNVRRLALLSWLWQTTPAHILSLMAAAAAALFVGTVVIASGRRSRLGLAAAAGLLAAAIGVMWAVVMPPLQGADEPDHLLSYGIFTNSPGLEADLRALAERTHFERIRFHTEEHFRPVDRETAFPEAWSGDVHAEQMQRRSPLALRMWRLIAATPGLRELTVPALLFGIRLVDVLVFALVVFGSTLAWLWSGTPRNDLWPLVGLTLVPTLPYFATMMSDWAFFASFAVLLSIGIVVLWQDGPRSSWSGPMIGLGLVLLVATGAAALALVPLVLVLLTLRVLMGAPGGSRPRDVVVFWGGFAGAVAIVYPIVRHLFQSGYQRYDALGAESLAMMASLNRALHFVAGQPWVLVIAVAAAGLAELGLTRLRAAPSIRTLFGRLVTAIVVLAVAALGVSLVASAVISLPTLPTIEAHPFSGARAYGVEVLVRGLTNARVTNFDHLLLTSFWSGFGWIDAILPATMLALFVVASVGALGLLTTRLLVAQDVRRLAWTAGLLGGAVASLFAYAVVSFLLHRNVHGRYLIALYVPMLAIVWQAVSPPSANGTPAAPMGRLVRLVLIACVIALHAYSLWFVSARYL